MTQVTSNSNRGVQTDIAGNALKYIMTKLENASKISEINDCVGAHSAGEYVLRPSAGFRLVNARHIVLSMMPYLARSAGAKSLL